MSKSNGKNIHSIALICQHVHYTCTVMTSQYLNPVVGCFTALSTTAHAGQVPRIVNSQTGNDVGVGVVVHVIVEVVWSHHICNTRRRLTNRRPWQKQKQKTKWERKPVFKYFPSDVRVHILLTIDIVSSCLVSPARFRRIKPGNLSHHFTRLEHNKLSCLLPSSSICMCVCVFFSSKLQL